MKHRFEVKPLSANRMWNRRGTKTFKSADYKQFQEDLRTEIMMEDWTWPFADEQVTFRVEAGLSNRGADIDNVVKPLLDTYQGMFDGFNDNKVYHIELFKTIVKKGEEFLDVQIRGWDEKNNKPKEKDIATNDSEEDDTDD